MIYIACMLGFLLKLLELFCSSVFLFELLHEIIVVVESLSQVSDFLRLFSCELFVANYAYTRRSNGRDNLLLPAALLVTIRRKSDWLLNYID